MATRSLRDELAIEERLDAKIDKDLAALGRMKTMQQMGLGRRHVVIDQTATPVDAPEAPVELPAGQVGGPSDQVEVPTSSGGVATTRARISQELMGDNPMLPPKLRRNKLMSGNQRHRPKSRQPRAPTQPASAEDVDKKDAA